MTTESPKGERKCYCEPGYECLTCGRRRIARRRAPRDTMPELGAS